MKRETDRTSGVRAVGGGQFRLSFWILVVASLVITKIGAFCWNHSIQIPLVNWLNDRRNGH